MGRRGVEMGKVSASFHSFLGCISGRGKGGGGEGRKRDKVIRAEERVKGCFGLKQGDCTIACPPILPW